MHEEQGSMQQEEPQQKNSRNAIFFGSRGLRAGWGCAGFLLILAAILFASNISLGFLLRRYGLPMRPPSPVPPLFISVSEGLSFLAVLAATFGMARFERRRFGGYGLGDRAWLARFGGGLLAGFIAVSALIGGLWALHGLILTRSPLTPEATWLYGLKWAAGFFLVALFEESLLRGYLLFTLGRSLGFWWAAILLSVLFGASHGHNQGESMIGLFSAGAVGLVFCLSIWYTRSLWWALGFHAAWDWGQSFFWGTLDSGQAVRGHWLNALPSGAPLLSGGATGPEGSLLVFPVVLLCVLGIALWWGRRSKQPAQAGPEPPPESGPESGPQSSPVA